MYAKHTVKLRCESANVVGVSFFSLFLKKKKGTPTQKSFKCIEEELSKGFQIILMWHSDEHISIG